MISPLLRKSSLFVGAALALATAANAQVIACDNFSYPDGSLVLQSGVWVNHSGTADDLLVSGGQVVVQHGTPSEDANLSFTPIAGDIYFGIDFSVRDQGVPISGTDNEYFAHFKDTGNNFAGRLDVVSPTGTGDFSVGIASDESTADAIWATDLTYGVTYRAIVRYDQDANIAELWIDAAASTGTSILGEDRADPGDVISAFALRQSDSDFNESVLVDNLIVGATFDSVLNVDASATLRNGGTNPASYTVSGGPVMGNTFQAMIDVGSTGHSFGQLIGFGGPLTFTLGTGQTLLIDITDPGGELLGLPASAGPIAGYTIAVPVNCALLGFSLSTQAVHIGGAPFLLSNAQDLVIGN
ncbi:MAG: hypothetical protein ACI8QS_002887 [Planctomycetota bacterium]|jgi:hypothetical protein